MYLHFYGNSLGQTWPWASVVRGTGGQVPGSWPEAAAAAVCREWGGTRKQASKGFQTSYQQEQRTRGLLSLYVQPSLVTVSSHVYLPMGSPPSERTMPWDREKREMNSYTPCGWERQKKAFRL